MGFSSSQSARWESIRFDIVAAIVGLAVAVLLFPLRFLTSQVFIETIPLLLGLACLLYLYSVKQTDHVGTIPSLPPGITRTLPSVVLFGAGAMMLLAVFQGDRSLGFFLISAFLGSLILLQVLLAHERDLNIPTLLLQIVALAFVFRFSALLVTPGYIGVDIWTHIMTLAEPIHAEGSLAAIRDDKHYTSPFFHLLTVSAALLYDVPVRWGLYLSLGLVMPVSILLVYATTALLVSERWAVLAAALFAMADYVVHWGLHLIPTSLGFVFFLAVLYWLLRVMSLPLGRRDFAFLVLLSLAVILTHQLTTLIMLALFLAAFLSQLVFKFGPFGYQQWHPTVFRAHRPVNLIGLVVFNFGFTIFMWSLTPFRQDTFLGTTVSWFRETLVEGAGFLNLARPAGGGDEGGEAAASAPTLLDHVVQYADVTGFLLLLGFTFLGCLYVVHRNRSRQSVITLLLAAVVMLVFVLGFPMLGIRNFVPTRWYAFLYAPLSILTVIGLRYLTREVGVGAVVACMLMLALVYPAGMVLASPSNADSPVFPDHHERLAYDESELAAVTTIEEMTGGPSASDIRPDQVLFTDHPYHTVFRRTGAHYAEPATVVPDEPVDHNVTVYRSAQTERATFFRDANEMGQLQDIPRDRLCRSEQAIIYHNGDVTMCAAGLGT